MSVSVFLRQLVLMSLYCWIGFSYLGQDFLLCFIIFNGEFSCLGGCFKAYMSLHIRQCHHCLCQTVLGFKMPESLCEQLGAPYLDAAILVTMSSCDTG